MIRSITSLLLCLALALGTVPFAPRVARADDVVASRVAPVVARILAYERTLVARAGGTVDLLVLHAGSGRSANEGQAFDLAFQSMGGATIQGLPFRVTVRAYSAGAVDAAAAAGIDVILVCSGLDSQIEAIANQARRRHVLTVGVERSQVSRATALAVVIEAGHPKIIANLAHARAEGVQLSSQLLRLSEVL